MKIQDTIKSWPQAVTLIPGEVYENVLTQVKFIACEVTHSGIGLVNLADGEHYEEGEIELSYLRARPDALLTFTEQD